MTGGVNMFFSDIFRNLFGVFIIYTNFPTSRLLDITIRIIRLYYSTRTDKVYQVRGKYPLPPPAVLSLYRLSPVTD